ncbi:hypothetical protein CGT98_13145 [Vibrio metoecus]|uniref:hypothetical protein n=1 Tax=Vibrio metoecus TaxID=1481663 RepID=UPI000BA970B7|nr:hypothetical protein [Vibrio metoecus]PAR38566.1 hypothetical protein CGT98_13145 [Vibrio metoecus]
MNVTFTPDQFSQLLELILTTNFLSFFAAITAYDFLKGLIVRLISQPISRYPNYFRMHQFVRKAHRRMDFENYYRNVRQFIHKNSGKS